MNKLKHYETIVERLNTHSAMKQFIHRNTIIHLSSIKNVLASLSKNLQQDVSKKDTNIDVLFIDKGSFECELKFSGDVLIFSMHTNVFTFDEDHSVHQLEYVKEDPKRAYCGLIQVYNFLADSVKYNRINDFGYLIARIFINSENHFFIEGKERLGFDYLGYEKQVFDQSAIEKIIAESILYCIDFELFTPPFEQSSILTLEEFISYSNAGMNTGKRLGFEFTVKNQAKDIP